MDYRNGRIYKIVSDLTDMIYIGSTTQPLCKRLVKHKGNYKESLTGKNRYITSFELFKLGETRIELIENYPCNNKEELNAREGYYIKLNNNICVNKNIAGRTSKEYKKDNKLKISEAHKKYREVHKEEIAIIQHKWYETNKEKKAEYNKQYKEENKQKLKDQQKEYNKINKDKLNEKRRQLYNLKKSQSIPHSIELT